MWIASTFVCRLRASGVFGTFAHVPSSVAPEMTETGFYDATLALAAGIAWIFFRRTYRDQYRATEKRLTDNELRELRNLQQLYAFKCFVLILIPFLFFSEYVLARYLEHSLWLSLVGYGGSLIIVLGLGYKLSRPLRDFYVEMGRNHLEPAATNRGPVLPPLSAWASVGLSCLLGVMAITIGVKEGSLLVVGVGCLLLADAIRNGKDIRKGSRNPTHENRD